MIGTTLLHYQILDEISRGGMGVVYRARDIRLDREVALKVLPAELQQDAHRRERLLHEARAASALEHPHVAVIHEVGEADGVTYIAMELIRGERLGDLIARGPLRPSRALDLVIEMAEGLTRAHEKNLIHRDLKPGNVMVTEDGHAKIIDFGLAKLVPQGASDAATASVHGPQTSEGLIVGTAAYMSPEQARGERVDHRTDVFALGLVLYEMVASRPAFRGQSNLDTLHAILSQPVPPLPALVGTPPETIADVQRIIDKCTAKDPDERYQGMRDLVVDLRSARRRIESSASGSAIAGAAPAAPAASPRALRAWAATALVAAGAAGVLWWNDRGDPPATAPGTQPALAVMYFENNTGDPSLDWLRTGLTDMLVTDLSQAAGFEVVGTDRLAEILRDLERADDPVMSADLVREVASRAAADTVLVGSYIKAGDTIRINARLQESQTGRIVTTERVDGEGESAVLSLVDELTRRFKAKLLEMTGPAPLLARPGETAEAGLDRGLVEITTSSLEAYRYYAEGLHFHERNLPEQAVPLLERAIEIDPDFAMAYAKLAVVHNNLVAFDKAEYYAREALNRAERLTTRERYYIEGVHYSRRPATLARAAETYRTGLSLHPEHQAMRHNLALAYANLGRYEESVAEYEELLRRGTSNPTTSGNLSIVLIELGQFDRALAVVEAFARQHPDNASGLRSLAAARLAAGRVDEAMQTFQQAYALDPRGFESLLGQRVVALLRHDWQAADEVSRTLTALRGSFPAFLGSFGLGQAGAARGNLAAAEDAWERAVAAPGVAPAPRAFARVRLARLRLRAGRIAEALDDARSAVELATGLEQEPVALQTLAAGEAMAGRADDASRTLSRLEEFVRASPSEADTFLVHWGRGEVLLHQGDAAAAATELEAALRALPPYGPVIAPPSPHSDLLYTTALALIRAGRDAEAAARLDRLQSGFDWPHMPDVYGRSFFLRAQIHERHGEGAQALDQYQTFVDLWGEGDMERAWVAEARRKLAGR